MARGPSPVELVADCEACGLEAGVVEIYDVLVAACRFGLPSTTRCKLCGDAHEGRFDRPPPKPLLEIAANRCPGCLAELPPTAIDDRRCTTCGGTATLARVSEPRVMIRERDLVNALELWAEREGFASVDALVQATFCEPNVTMLFGKIDRGERLEVVADPFANMGMRPGKSGSDAKEPKAAPPKHEPKPPASLPEASSKVPSTVRDQTPPVMSARPFPPQSALPKSLAERSARVPVPTTPGSPAPLAPHAAPAPHATVPPPTEAPRSAPPRAIVYPLVSLIVADGEIHEAERALVDRFLQAEGMAPLTDDELRIHLPAEVAHLVPKERREGVVQLMCEAASVDGMPDESERRVIRAYATAWDVPDEKVDFWMWGYESMGTSLARQLWLKIRRFVLSARWSDEVKDTR